MTNFTLVQLRYFVAAAELGSMTAVSQELLISQSAVSTAIANLERELGVQLLIRQHARGLTLTSAGARLLIQARDLLAQAQELEESAQGYGGSLSGQLSVGCFATLAPFYIPKLLSHFNKTFPDIHVTLVEGELEALQKALLDGHCELALLYDINLSDQLEKELVRAVPAYVLLPKTHPLARARAVSLSDVATEPMIMFDLPHSRDYFMSVAQAAGVELNVRFKTTNFETVRALVAEGHGYSILNQAPAGDRTYDGGRVVTKPLLSKYPPLPIVLARLRGVRTSRRAVAFTSSCRSFFRSLEKQAAASHS